MKAENVFVDRAVDLQAQQRGWVSVTVTAPSGVTIPSGVSLAGLVAPAAFPIQQSVTQSSATINDATVTVNTQDVLPQILRLSDMAEARKQRTCPTMLDRYAKYPDTNAVSNSPLGLYGKGFSPDEIPNGAFNGFQFTTAAGVVPTSSPTVVNGYTIVNGVPTLTYPLGGSISVASAVIASGVCTMTLTTAGQSAYFQLGQTVVVAGLVPASGTLNGSQVLTAVGTGTLSFATAATGAVTATSATVVANSYTFPLYFTWISTEKLLLPPFIFTGQEELSTGFFGVQNFQVQLNIAPASQARSIRVSSGLSLQGDTAGEFGSATLETGTSFNWGNASTTGVFVGDPRLLVQFLTPSLDIPLPPKNIVPFMEFPRYISSKQPAPASAKIVFGMTTTGEGQIQSVTTTLPNIPDLMMIYVKPTSYPNATNGDWTLPITNISLNFDNFSGLLANHSQIQLYKMSIDNGLDMDWNLWSGQVNAELSGAGNSGTANTLGGVVGSAGGALVLRPGRDFALQAGQAPGLNYWACTASAA